MQFDRNKPNGEKVKSALSNADMRDRCSLARGRLDAIEADDAATISSRLPFASYQCQSTSIRARGKDDLEKAAAGPRQHGVSVVATPADVTRTDDVQQVIDETIKQLGRIDIVVNNTGDAVWAEPGGVWPGRVTRL
jgi:NAD(P)-dependent dehydrogenase (short-subunit alcohol dehydrogenase family)